MKAVVVTEAPLGYSETFIHDHIRQLGPHTEHVVLQELSRPPQRTIGRIKRLIRRTLTGKPDDYAARRNRDLCAYLRSRQPDVLLAEYGLTAVDCLDACQMTSTPLVAHFHGFDASRRDLLKENQKAYQRLFRQATIIAVSKRMQRDLIEMGSDPEATFWSPCGVDVDRFCPAEGPATSQKLLAVGRFVEKKGPVQTLLAFAEVANQIPEITLTMLGDGPLYGVCRDLVEGLRLHDKVQLPGAVESDRVRQEMATAAAFLQHSVESENGDREGTPVAVLEAGAMGLPVIATRHAGIPDVVVDGETGLLVEENDIHGMAALIRRAMSDAPLRQKLGAAARLRIESHFATAQNEKRLRAAIECAINSRS